MESGSSLHSRFNLYTTSDAYYLEPTNATGAVVVGAKQILTIYRNSGEIVFNGEAGASRYSKTDFSFPVFGIFGILSLPTFDYLIVITSRTPHGRISGHTIYRAKEFKILPLSPASSSPLNVHPAEQHLLRIVQKHLDTGVFWFSYGWNLTKNLQAQALTAEEDKGKPLWETADDRFFWNKFLHSRFLDIATSNAESEISRFILPFMYGSFDLRPAQIGPRFFQFALISRRSRYRAGTRYFRRGIDDSGHVANFNETEQIILLNPEGKESFGGEFIADTRLSYVQTRGSAPFYWAEINNLRYVPDLQIMETENTLPALRLHLTEQLHHYGTQYIVNLVKAKGRERHVKEAYERRLQDLKLEGVNYEYFDFHNECKYMKWDRIHILLDRLEEGVKAGGYFHQSLSKSTLIKTQTAVVRSNCMDCLDRTNVVQSALAKRVLNDQLRVVGILKESETIDDHEEFSRVFREVWADHADYVSNAYAGSGALKTVFTRTGKQTPRGNLQDFNNSIMRYVKNNYLDGDRQDAFDIVTGAWVARRSPAMLMSIVADTRPLFVRAMPYILGFSLFMLFASVTLPRTSTLSHFYYNIFWTILAFVSVVYILLHGVEYVSWPRLNSVIDTIYYEGPGYKSSERGKGVTIPAWITKLLTKNGVRVPKKVRVGLGHRYKLSGTADIEMEMGTGIKKRVD